MIPYRMLLLLPWDEVGEAFEEDPSTPAATGVSLYTVAPEAKFHAIAPEQE